MAVRADILSDELIDTLVRKGTLYIFVELKYGPRFLEEYTLMAEGSVHMRTIIRHLRTYPGSRVWVDVGFITDSRLRVNLDDLGRILNGFIKVWGDVEHPDYYGDRPSGIITEDRKSKNVSNPEDYAIMSDFTYSPVGTFAYNPLGGELRFINLSLNDAPAWDSRFEYSRHAAVQRGMTYWIALVPSVGIDPLMAGQQVWSPLIPTKVGPSRGPQGPQGPIGGANNNQVINIGGRPCNGGGNDPGLPNGAALEITSFSVSPTSVQMGETGPRLLTFAWALNGTPFNQVITPGNTKVPNTERSFTTSFNLLTTTTFKLEVWGSGNEDYDSAEVTIPMVNPRYWGTSAEETLDGAQIKTLQGEPASDVKFSKTLNPRGEYIYIAYPVRLGMGAMYVGGFYNTAWEQTVVNVTNSVGFTEAYNVFRSTYVQNGSNITVEIK